MKILSFLALLLVACTAPIAPRAPIPTHTIRVAIEDGVDLTGWLAWQRKALLKLWPRLDATGYRWVLDDHAPDVRVRTYASSSCAHAGGRYEIDRPFVEIDPVCVHTAEELRFAVGHELLHWLCWRDSRFAGHLCMQGDLSPDCHPSIRGIGMLSPSITNNEDGTSSALAQLSPDDLRLLRALRIAR